MAYRRIVKLRRGLLHELLVGPTRATARRMSVASTEVSEHHIHGSNANSLCQCPPVADENSENIRTTSTMDDCNARALTPVRKSSIAVLSFRLFSCRCISVAVFGRSRSSITRANFPYRHSDSSQLMTRQRLPDTNPVASFPDPFASEALPFSKGKAQFFFAHLPYHRSAMRSRSCMTPSRSLNRARMLPFSVRANGRYRVF
jgi:hypothetical protein